MSRKATGTVRVIGGRWHAKFTRADGTRSPWVPIPGVALADVAGAKAYAARQATRVKSAGLAGDKRETVEAYSERWLAARPARMARDNRSHLSTHILPVIGGRAMHALTSADGDTLVASLDKKIEAGALSSKSARNVWGTVGRMLRDAAHAKPSTGLRCLEANPFRDVQAPERSTSKRAKQFIYPSEFLAFVACLDVPIRWRVNATIAVYLGLRDGEQRALRWEHVDLEHGIVNVCEVFDRLTKTSREGTKSGASRTVPIPGTLLPLLREMSEAAGGEGLVCRGIASQRAMARGLRTWMRKAGVTRAALFASTAVNLPVRWHDLRATCGTWLAVRGAPGSEIRDVLGHTQVSMTDRYMREATAVRGGGFGEPFPTLPACLFSIDPNRPDTIDAVQSSLKQALSSGVDGTRRIGQVKASKDLAPGIALIDTIRDRSIPGDLDRAIEQVAALLDALRARRPT